MQKLRKLKSDRKDSPKDYFQRRGENKGAKFRKLSLNEA
jgi:hypothetical protein